MRILLVTDWNRLRGGAEAYIGMLYDGFTAAGDEVSLLTSSVGDRGEGRADWVAHGSESMLQQSVLQIANPWAIRTLALALRNHRPDVVVINMFLHHLSPAILTLLRKYPTVILVTDYKLICPVGSKLLPDGRHCDVKAGLPCWRNGCTSLAHWLRDRPRYALLRHSLRNVNRIVSAGRSPKNELQRSGLPSRNLEMPVAPPGEGYLRQVDPSPRFLFVGRLDREKGVDVLLAAMRRVLPTHPQATLRIVGRGADHERLVGLSQDLGLDSAVTFTGWLEPPQVEREISAAWALVAPSLWAEPFGMVAPEAMVRGVPVIASDCGGFADTVTDGETGFLVPAGDTAALADRMARVAAGDLSHTLPEDLRQSLEERFSVKTHLVQLRAILAETTEGPPG